MAWSPERAARERRNTRIVLATVLGGALLFVGLLGLAVYRSGDVTPHVAALDSIAVPAGWRLQGQVSNTNLLFGSQLARFYVVDQDTVDLVEPAQRMLEAAGFAVTQPRGPDPSCRPPSARPGVTASATATPCPEVILRPCLTDGSGTMCGTEGDRGREHVDVLIYRRGQTTIFGAGPDADRRFGAPGLTLIRITDSWDSSF